MTYEEEIKSLKWQMHEDEWVDKTDRDRLGYYIRQAFNLGVNHGKNIQVCSRNNITHNPRGV